RSKFIFLEMAVGVIGEIVTNQFLSIRAAIAFFRMPETLLCPIFMVISLFDNGSAAAIGCWLDPLVSRFPILTSTARKPSTPKGKAQAAQLARLSESPSDRCRTHITLHR
ncbi:hypothetical protein KAW55_04465, partial [bacterium]|nr:hypothetical protein [bacterium]